MADDNRLALDKKIRAFMKSIDQNIETNVYFQPPESIQLKYPCIVYDYSRPDLRYANNNPYKVSQRYDVTIIDRDPESEIVKQFIFFGPTVSFNSRFIRDNLRHTIFTLYYYNSKE